MKQTITRRSVVAGGASLVVLGGSRPAPAQAKIKLRFSCAFTEADLRAQAYKEFAAAIKDDFDFEPYWGNTLFKQGAELVALQRDNLDLCNLAPADISKQIPAWSLMTSAYLFRDSDHLKKVFEFQPSGTVVPAVAPKGHQKLLKALREGITSPTIRVLLVPSLMLASCTVCIVS